MAYDTEKLLKEALQIIKKKKCLFIEDIVVFMPCTKSTFYLHFTIDSNELDTIKEKLQENRVALKHSMRNKWSKSNNATLQVSLMKLIGTDEERRALSLSHHDLTTKNKELPTPSLINYDELPTEVLEAILNASTDSSGQDSD